MTDADARAALGNILVATDFSESAWCAAERAARLPLRPGASLDLLHVAPDAYDPTNAARMTADARQRLEDARERVMGLLVAAGNGDHNASISIQHGKPFVEIVRHARHGRAELIVVGRHGERTFRDLLIGSTAERVIRKGDVSVLVVARAPEGTYRRPLVAVDLSDSSRLALELTLRICGPAVDGIDVLHVVTLPTSHVPEAALALGLEPLRLELEQRARTELSQLLGQIDGRAPWNLMVKTGDPRQVILDEARARGSDLVALGTKGRTGLAHTLIGSVAEGVVRAASGDVLVARLPRTAFDLP